MYVCIYLSFVCVCVSFHLSLVFIYHHSILFIAHILKPTIVGQSYILSDCWFVYFPRFSLDIKRQWGRRVEKSSAQQVATWISPRIVGSERKPGERKAPILPQSNFSEFTPNIYIYIG